MRLLTTFAGDNSMRSILCIWLVLTCAALQAAEPETPPVFHSRNPRVPTPIWVSAEEALDSSGRIRPGTVRSGEAYQLHRIIDALPPDWELDTAPAASPRCEYTFGALVDDAPNMSSPPDWENLANRAATGKVFFGRVTGTRVGLYHGTPFTVVTVRARQATSETEPVTVHVLYPKGSLLIEGRRICTDDSRYTAAPHVGEEIVFVATNSVSSEGSLYRVPAEQVFFERGGRLVIPRGLRRDPHVRSLGSLEAVRDALLSRRRATR